MAPTQPLPDSVIEPVARLLGDYGTGTDISQILRDVGISDESPGDTKWRRLDRAFRDVQSRDKSANRILAFIAAYLAPVRYVGRTDEFERRREELNITLAFAGLEYRDDGQFQSRDAAQTLSDADERASRIRAKFKGRTLHPEVLKYCRAEMMEENYFHAVFEATKGLAERIREKSGVDGDGAKLVDRVFLGDKPSLALNSLRTETEWSQQRGFAALVKGCFAAVRNPLAHEPKILWEGEEDTADYLSLISLLHRKLDECVPTRMA